MNARSKALFKPVRLRCTRLIIGDWVQQPVDDSKECFCVKFLFSRWVGEVVVAVGDADEDDRKKFLWEWKVDQMVKRKIEVSITSINQLCNIVLGGGDWGCRIEGRWADYQQIGPNNGRLYVGSSVLPVMFDGVVAASSQPKWSITSDFTNGQCSRSMLHELDICVDQETMKSVLQTMGDFDSRCGGSGVLPRLQLSCELIDHRLIAMTTINPKRVHRVHPMMIPGATVAAATLQNPQSALLPGEPALKRARTLSSGHLSDQVYRVPDTFTANELGCTCVNDCNPVTCACSMSMRSCSANSCGCQRRACHNPLSRIAEGASLACLQAHRCLADNWSVVGRNTQAQLLGRVRLPCCRIDVPLLQILTLNTASCPCGLRYDYSFCRSVLLRKDTAAQMFHCAKCRLCQPPDARHCAACDSCSTPSRPCACIAAMIPPPVEPPAIKASPSPSSSAVRAEDDAEGLRALSPIDTDSPAALSPLSDVAATVMPVRGRSLADLSHWQQALMGLGRQPKFYQELRGLVIELNR